LSPLGISLLLFVAFALFTALSARKLAIVAALQPEVRWDRPWARLRTVLANGLLQQRMIRREWKPGVMHTVIFLGFVSLLVRKVQLIVISDRLVGPRMATTAGARPPAVMPGPPA